VLAIGGVGTVTVGSAKEVPLMASRPIYFSEIGLMIEQLVSKARVSNVHVIPGSMVISKKSRGKKTKLFSVNMKRFLIDYL